MKTIPHENFEDLLRDHGLSVTSARMAVLWAVANFPHADADMLTTQARKKSGSLSKQSVYDNLHALTEKGILRTVQPMGHSARFEFDHKDNHHHLVCRSCDMMMDVPCTKGKAPCLNPQEAQGFILDEAEVVFWGLCPACQKKNSNKQKRRV